MNGYNFTERVRKVLSMSREEAARLSYEYVGTEHLLLGLIAEGEGVAATVLFNLGVDGKELRATIERTAKPGTDSPTGPDLPYASRAKRVLELAMAEARDLGHAYVGTEHLLLGLLAEGKGVAAQVLMSAGVTLDSARADTLRILGTEPVRARRPEQNDLPVLTARVKDVLAAARGASHPSLPMVVAIALLRQSDGSARAILDRLGVDVARVVETLESEAADAVVAAQQAGTDFVEALKRVMRRAEREAEAMLAEGCGTGHLLIALLETSPAVDAVFAEHRVTAMALRRELRRISG